MMRGFRWEDYGPEHAVLYGPEYYTVAAVVILDDSWRVMSNTYHSLNLSEKNTLLPMGEIKRRVLIRLGKEIEEKKEDLEKDMSSLLNMLFSEMERKEKQ